MSTRKVKSETTLLVETIEQEEGKTDKEYTVSFKMNVNDHERLESYAKDQKMSKSMIIRTAVNKYVSQVEGVVDVKLPLADYKNLMFLIESGQVLSLEAAVAEAVRAYNMKKLEELKELKSAKSLM